ERFVHRSVAWRVSEQAVVVLREVIVSHILYHRGRLMNSMCGGSATVHQRIEVRGARAAPDRLLPTGRPHGAQPAAHPRSFRVTLMAVHRPVLQDGSAGVTHVG